jgi:tRNA nucleotidyltransferase/poly(A) polymerase
VPRGSSRALELVREVLAGEQAWIVGGTIRDEALGRPVTDVDVASREPRRATEAFHRQSGGALFPLSERHGAWRVALADGSTVDFTPLRDGIRADLATRDFTINAIAAPVAGGDWVDPFGGGGDLRAGLIRAVSDRVFDDDPLRLLRAVRLEDELDFRIDGRTERLIENRRSLVGRPAGERILLELLRLSRRGFLRLDELGLLEPLGGSVDRLDCVPEGTAHELLLVAVFGRELERLPISNELRRLERTLLAAHLPDDLSPRSVHRFRRASEPFALEAVAFLRGSPQLREAVCRARRDEPREPLVRGDELGLPPGPEIGRLLERIEEERAAGAIVTREDALALARRESGR